MPCQVGRQLFVDAADIGQLLQVGVYLLVARHGQQHLSLRHSGSVRKWCVSTLPDVDTSRPPPREALPRSNVPFCV